MERTIYLLVAYDGTEYHGWQSQPDVRTVQEALEQAVRRTVRHQVDIIGSGRTDSGVHAAGHASNFVTSCDLPASRLRHAIGSRLPKDVSLVLLRDVHPEFNARRSAISKLYRYRLYNTRRRPVEDRLQRYTYHYWHELDMARMQAAGQRFIGEKDFTSMAGRDGLRESMVRRVIRCDVERHLNEIRIDVEGDGFLYRQVRNMVGTLINIGRGQWEPEYVDEILEARDRAMAGPTVPARGLCLQWVRYPSHLLVPPQQPEDGVPAGSAAVTNCEAGRTAPEELPPGHA